MAQADCSPPAITNDHPHQANIFRRGFAKLAQEGGLRGFLRPAERIGHHAKMGDMMRRTD
ncbi:MAG: hypothetical protein ABIP14_03190 [Blastocatellia bacterium]